MREKRGRPTAQSALKWTWHFLARLNVAVLLIAIVLLLAALGSCFPQSAPATVAADAERLARWEAGVRARFGPLTALLAAVGVFRWFHSPAFLAPLTLLAVATLVCTLDRWRGVWRQTFHRPARPPDAIFDVAPLTARLTAPSPRVVREALAGQGFCVRSETAGSIVYLRGDRNRLAPLATLVTHLAVLLLLLGAILSSGYGWRETLTIEPGETVEVGHESRLTLRNEGFTIARHPDGSVAAYNAEVTLIEGDREVAHRGVQVNEPLNYGGVGFYLSGYEQREGGYRVTLVAVRDPGYGLVVVAGFLLLLGLTVSFNFPHCWIHARIEPDGILCLAGRVERWAGDFGREFAGLAEELRRLAEAGKEETSEALPALSGRPGETSEV